MLYLNGYCSIRTRFRDKSIKKKTFVYKIEMEKHRMKSKNNNRNIPTRRVIPSRVWYMITKIDSRYYCVITVFRGVVKCPYFHRSGDPKIHNNKYGCDRDDARDLRTAEFQTRYVILSKVFKMFVHDVLNS